ncbi:MAG: electron transport complex subunit RsxA, partial [Firmicutes bacterium]|nr:electron transport complex subunit RsxA [Bacillota bacterium]
IVLACAATYFVYNLILVPLGIEYLYNIAFILIIASLVQFVEMFIKKSAPSLYQSLGVYLPLITTNCAVLGVAVSNMQAGYSFIESVLAGLGTAGGFALAIILFAGLREDRIELADTPKAFDGFPTALVSAGFMSIAFLGFSGLI